MTYLSIENVRRLAAYLWTLIKICYLCCARCRWHFRSILFFFSRLNSKQWSIRNLYGQLESFRFGCLLRKLLWIEDDREFVQCSMFRSDCCCSNSHSESKIAVCLCIWCVHGHNNKYFGVVFVHIDWMTMDKCTYLYRLRCVGMDP